MEYKYHGIILGKNDISETDRIYTVYTLETGKIRILAKGVRKANAKLAGNLETFTLVEIFLAKSKGRGNVIGAIAEENFFNLKKNADILEEIFWSMNIFSCLVSQEEKDEIIFFLLLSYFSVMNNISKEKNKKIEARIFSIGLIFKLIFHLGYGLQIEKCSSCGERLRSEKNFFEASLGGIICEKCLRERKKKIKISDNSIKLIRIFLTNKIENFGKIKTDKKNLDNLRIVLNEAIAWIDN